MSAATSLSASCIFCKIIRGEIPSRKLAETAHSFAFLDVGPLSKGAPAAASFSLHPRRLTPCVPLFQATASSSPSTTRPRSTSCPTSTSPTSSPSSRSLRSQPALTTSTSSITTAGTPTRSSTMSTFTCVPRPYKRAQGTGVGLARGCEWMTDVRSPSLSAGDPQAVGQRRCRPVRPPSLCLLSAGIPRSRPSLHLEAPADPPSSRLLLRPLRPHSGIKWPTTSPVRLPFSHPARSPSLPRSAALYSRSCVSRALILTCPPTPHTTERRRARRRLRRDEGQAREPLKVAVELVMSTARVLRGLKADCRML